MGSKDYFITPDIIDSYIKQMDWRVRENANSPFSLQSMNHYISGKVTALYWLKHKYPSEIADAHVDGDFHLHDLGSLSAYCCGWDMYDLLENGFRGSLTAAVSAPPKHFRTALGQVVNFLYTLQGETAGAQAFASFDTHLAPFVRADKLSYEEVKQALQEFLFNMNVPTRAGSQVPFTNITLDITPSPALANLPAIVGGKPYGYYGDFQEEMDMINMALAELMIEGDALGRGFSFPIPTYNVTPDFEPSSPVVRKIFELAAKFGSPYFANFISSDLKPEDVRSMCPLHPATPVLVRSSKGISVKPIGEVHKQAEKTGAEYEVLHNGRWIKALTVSNTTVGCVKVRTVNGAETIMDLRHEQPVKRARGSSVELLTAAQIEVGMYLPFNAVQLPEDSNNYKAGYAVGAYLGDGSIDKGALIYSLNNGKNLEVAEQLKDFFVSMGFTVSEYEGARNVLFLRVGCSNGAAEAWLRQFVAGDSASTKQLTRRVFNMGASFLRGLIDGWYATDGGDRGRIYTTSPRLVEDFQVVCSLLGLAYEVDIENPDQREGRYSEIPVYTIKFHTRPSYGDVFFYEDGYWWFKVDAVEQFDYSGEVYCFVVDSDEHLFQLANGLVTHNCRLRLDLTELRKKGGGLFGANPLTGSIGVVTINLPRIGYLSNSKEEYFQRLGYLVDLAIQSLNIKRVVVEDLTEKGLYPYSKFYLRHVKEARGSYWANHFGTVGIVGMNEACLNLLGVDIGYPDGYNLAKETLRFIRERLVAAQQKYGLMYNLEATPAEGTSYRLAKIDKEKYPDIIVANEEAVRTEGAAPYYTNSTMLPVGYTDDIFTLLEHQAPLQALYTGGTVWHMFLGESQPDPEACASLVRKVFSNYELPYMSITPTYSICPSHGYLFGQHVTCPKCGAATEVYSRVVGYYRPVSLWNDGKQAEFKDRKLFDSAFSTNAV